MPSLVTQWQYYILVEQIIDFWSIIDENINCRYRSGLFCKPRLSLLKIGLPGHLRAFALGTPIYLIWLFKRIRIPSELYAFSFLQWLWWFHLEGAGGLYIDGTCAVSLYNFCVGAAKWICPVPPRVDIKCSSMVMEYLLMIMTVWHVKEASSSEFIQCYQKWIYSASLWQWYICWWLWQ